MYEFFRFPFEAFQNKNNKTPQLPCLEYSLCIRITESSEQPYENSVLPGQMRKQRLGEVNKLAYDYVFIVGRARIQMHAILTIEPAIAPICLSHHSSSSCLWRSYTFTFARLAFAFHLIFSFYQAFAFQKLSLLSQFQSVLY